jgi:hypothetical protein
MSDDLHPLERVRLQQEEAGRRAEGRRRFALDQGYVLVQVSPRRYSVAKVTSSGGYFAGFTGRDCFATLNAEVVFGPATWAACRDFIAENAMPLPPELCK